MSNKTKHQHCKPKEDVRSKLEIQEEMQQYGNIKRIKVKRDRYGYGNAMSHNTERGRRSNQPN